MFYHVVACISPDVAAEVRDLVVEPPAERAFETLKQRLIQRAPSLEQRRLQEVLSADELSDLNPSDLLRRLRQLLGSKTTRSVNNPLLREAFLRRLSPTVRGVLDSAEDMSLDALAQLADKVAQVAARSSPESCVPDISAEVLRLRGQVSKLSKLIEALESLAISSAGTRRRARSKSSSNASPALAKSRGGAKPLQLKECWYHRRYGDQAANCMAPCVRSIKGISTR